MESVSAAAFLSIVVGAALFAMPCRATQYTVGDTSGWDASTNFNTWLTGKTFKVGDTLVFQYSSSHNVMDVSKADYDSCQAGNAIKSYSDGNTQIPLKSAGTKYFICGTPGHCAGGMKIAIPVKAAAATTPAAKTPATTPAATTPAAKTPATTPAAKTPASSGTPSTPTDSNPSTGSPSTKSAATAVSVKNVGLFFACAFVMVAGIVL